jgi:hypothetical protein
MFTKKTTTAGMENRKPIVQGHLDMASKTEIQPLMIPKGSICM